MYFTYNIDMFDGISRQIKQKTMTLRKERWMGVIMGKRNKVVNLLIVLVMCLSIVFTGCSSKESEGSKVDTGVEEVADTYKIGLNYMTSSSYVLVTLRDNSVKVIEGFGGEALAIDDEASPEKIISDIENLISAGCNGVIVWALTDEMFLPISELCERAKVPFVLNDKVPIDEEILKTLKENPYFAGGIGPANDVYGESAADYAIAKGYKTCIISSGDVADPTDAPRIKAFRAKYEAAGGKVLTEINSTLSDMQDKADNMLIANPNPDFVYAVGPDYSNAACDALAKYPDFDTVVLSSGLDRSSLDRLADKNSPLKFVNGDNWVAGSYSAVVLQNWLDGTPFLDEKGESIVFTNIMPFSVPAEKYDLFKKFFIDEFMFTETEINNMSQTNNPDFTYEVFVEKMTNFSLDSVVLQRYADGKVTNAELEAAGIEKP